MSFNGMFSTGETIFIVSALTVLAASAVVATEPDRRKNELKEKELDLKIMAQIQAEEDADFEKKRLDEIRIQDNKILDMRIQARCTAEYIAEEMTTVLRKQFSTEG